MGLFTKESEPGSAMIAAGALHGSAHVHAIRYGEKGSKTYRRAYSQHVGRFLSCLREVSKAGPDDEARDQAGRWASSAGAKTDLYGTTGVVGLSREKVVGKVQRFLDESFKHQPGLPRAATYSAALAAKVSGYVTGLPHELQDNLEHHAAHTAGHVASAAGNIARKVLEHPGFRRIAAKALTRVRKDLEPDEHEGLKGIVANVMADTRLDPRISCDDQRLAAVARGAYQHCHDRLCALKQAAN